MKKVVVAMSGGVDSSVAAALLAEQGVEALGVTLKLMGRVETGFGCCGSPADIDDAKRVCEALGIPHYTLDLAELFADKVIAPFIDAYLKARTPNPCVECNRSLKFGYLLGLAQAWGADAVATGHYARVENGRLLKAVDAAKDQTYFLYSLTPLELAKVCFPIGALAKAQVRQRARALGLRTADKAESQEICFVPRRDYRAFLESRAAEGAAAFTSGPIRDRSGKEVGRHQGLASYTIGQRKGLGLTTPEPRYVVELQPETNTLVVGQAEETLARRFEADGVSWTSGNFPDAGRAEVRIRHRHVPAAAALVDLGSGRVGVEFEAPQRAVTPGQAAVFYRGEEVLGGGLIARAEVL